MIRIENTEVMGWEAAIRGMRNPLASWSKSDTDYEKRYQTAYEFPPNIGSNDYDLMMRLRNAGTDHRKFMRMIVVYADITAPRYWWTEADTYRMGVEKNSCSTMHTIHKREFILDDFSHEHMSNDVLIELERIIDVLNIRRREFLETKERTFWWDMIQLLPQSYNQKRTMMMNYEVLSNIYKSRKGHKLNEWSGFINWINLLPYSELITGEN